MQDLSKIEQEHLQANDVGDDYVPKLTHSFADEVLGRMHVKMIREARATFEEFGLDDLLAKEDIEECFRLLHDHLHDAIGDMPIWDIVKRGEA